VLTKEEYDAKRVAIAGPAPAPATPPAPVPAPAAAPASLTPQPPVPTMPPVPTATPAAPPTHNRVATRTGASPPESTKSARAETPESAPVAAPPPVPAETTAAPKAPDTSAEEPAPSAGCEDAEYKAGKEKGPQERFFPAAVPRVRRAAAAALKSLDFNIHKDAGNQIEATRKRHLGVVVGKGGERVILNFHESQRGGQPGTLVTGQTKKAFVGRLGQKSWTNAVLAQTACVLREGTK